MNRSRLKITLIVALFPCILFAQDYLSEERGDEIRFSGKYFYGIGTHFDADYARRDALTNLNNQIIEVAVSKSIQRDEVLNALEMNIHSGNLRLRGRYRVLVWTAKDSVFVTTTKPLTRLIELVPVAQSPEVREEVTPTPPPVQPAPIVHQAEKVEEVAVLAQAPATQQVTQPVATSNPVLNQMIAAGTLQGVRRIVQRGFIRGAIGEGSSGFTNPEQCIIAVFTTDGTLVALLDVGSGSRIDLISGRVIQNHEEYFRNYVLWYLLQRNN